MRAELARRMVRARELSWAAHGKRLTIFTPGMFTAYGRRGRFPAVSLTGGNCERGCLHCGGRLLKTMPPARSAAELVALGKRLWQEGQRGMLLSGGGDAQGRLPWPEALPAIAQLSRETGLFLSAHVARLDPATARALKQAGIRQALIDVVGAAETAREVLRLADGLAAQEETLAACQEAGLEVVPHIIVGLHRGEIRGEARALEIARDIAPRRLVFVVLMPLKGTPLAGIKPPEVGQVADLICRGRDMMPRASIHLGCARPRGTYRAELDAAAVASGINALALASEGALGVARELGIEVEYRDTCCSLWGLDE